MLQRAVTARSATVLIGSLCLGLAHCAGVPDGEPTPSVGRAIIGGTIVDSPGTPVVYLLGKEGSCTGVLVAPNLVATARHCVAATTPGPFTCTASGELVLTGSGTGQIGVDDDPRTLRFYTAAHVNQGSAQEPDAIGQQIVSTQTMTACRDDLAFVILDRAIATATAASIRLDRPTQIGEAITVWGYGLTSQIEPVALRRNDAKVFGVGPDLPASDTQSAPLRSVRVSSVTCLGDSGGPITSGATGAVIAVVSLGSQASANGPYCKDTGVSDTVGPRLGAYRQTVLAAFNAAQATPILEGSGPTPDAAAPSDDAPPVDGGAEETSVAEASEVVDAASGDEQDAAGEQTDANLVSAAGGSCSMALANPNRSGAVRDAFCALVLAAGATRRRKT